MRIVNPAFGLQEGGIQPGQSAPAAAADWASDPVAIISNSKPNAMELLEGLRQQLGGVRSIENIEHHSKSSASQPAPPELIDKVTKSYRAAILALAD